MSPLLSAVCAGPVVGLVFGETPAGQTRLFSIGADGRVVEYQLQGSTPATGVNVLYHQDFPQAQALAGGAVPSAMCFAPPLPYFRHFASDTHLLIAGGQVTAVGRALGTLAGLQRVNVPLFMFPGHSCMLSHLWIACANVYQGVCTFTVYACFLWTRAHVCVTVAAADMTSGCLPASPSLPAPPHHRRCIQGAGIQP